MAVTHVIVAGLLVQTIYLIGVFYAIFLGISTGVIALIVGLQPLITGAMAGSVLGEKVSLRQWCGLALGFLGWVLGGRINGFRRPYWFLGYLLPLVLIALIAALLTLAADGHLWGQLYLASLEESGLLLPDGSIPPITMERLRFNVEIAMQLVADARHSDREDMIASQLRHARARAKLAESKLERAKRAREPSMENGNCKADL